MKSTRRTLAILSLIFALVAPAAAGDMHAGITPEPTPDPAATQTATAPTDSTGAAQASTSDSYLATVISAALSVAQALVSLG